MSSAPDTKEREFTLKLRHALDESAARLPAFTRDKLAAARHTALARKKSKPQATPAFAYAALHIPAFEQRVSPLRQLARVLPLVALIVGIVAVAYWEDAQHATELAEIDAAMLSDDLPLNAYLDHGFNAYLSRAL
jgi:hypothetical protein